MTPQEQYPKFYSHPERYLGIEVECIKDYTFDNFFYGNIHIVNLELLSYVSLHKLWQHFKPLFKRQTGYEFIKDLEDAVGCGLADACRNIIKAPKGIIAFDSPNHFTEVIMINEHDISKVLSLKTNFDTAAYVDRMRKLGYYL